MGHIWYILMTHVCIAVLLAKLHIQITTSSLIFLLCSTDTLNLSKVKFTLPPICSSFLFAELSMNATILIQLSQLKSESQLLSPTHPVVSICHLNLSLISSLLFILLTPGHHLLPRLLLTKPELVFLVLSPSNLHSKKSPDEPCKMQIWCQISVFGGANACLLIYSLETHAAASLTPHSSCLLSTPTPYPHQYWQIRYSYWLFPHSLSFLTVTFFTLYYNCLPFLLNRNLGFFGSPLLFLQDQADSET